MPNVLISSEVRLAVSTSLHSALGYQSPADCEKKHHHSIRKVA